MELLSPSFFQSEDVLAQAKALLGTRLVTNIEGHRCVARITETEAYRMEDDTACHSFGGRRTARTETMFLEGGHAYVYICYGIHHLFNVIVGPVGVANAVLIRAVEPLEGIDAMLARRAKDGLTPQLTSGPGVLSQAMGIRRTLHDGVDLRSKDSPIYLAQPIEPIPIEDIVTTRRIGIESCGKSKDWPWRFFVGSSRYVSAKRSF